MDSPKELLRVPALSRNREDVFIEEKPLPYAEAKRPGLSCCDLKETNVVPIIIPSIVTWIQAFNACKTSGSIDVADQGLCGE